jgi:hypothetical protein
VIFLITEVSFVLGTLCPACMLVTLVGDPVILVDHLLQPEDRPYSASAYVPLERRPDSYRFITLLSYVIVAATPGSADVIHPLTAQSMTTQPAQIRPTSPRSLPRDFHPPHRTLVTDAAKRFRHLELSQGKERIDGRPHVNPARPKCSETERKRKPQQDRPPRAASRIAILAVSR